MSTETAQLVVYLIATVEFIVWLAALQFVLLTARRSKSENQAAIEAGEPLPAHWVLGSTEVEGQPAELVRRAAGLLARQGGGTPVKILDCTENRLVFEGLHFDARNRVAFRRGELRFASVGRTRTRIDYAVEPARRGLLLRLAGLFLILGLTVLIAVAGLLLTFVVSSPNPGIRGQAFQMFQAIHLLWPPFLFAGLYRHNIRSVRSTFEALTNNLPFAE